MPRLLPLALLMFIAACGGAAPVVAPVTPVAPTPSGPAYEALYVAGGTLIRHDLAWDRADPVRSDLGAVNAVFPAPNGGSVAFVLASSDSTRLGVWGTSVRFVDAQPSPVVVTVDWSPDSGALAFGRYQPIRRGGRDAMGSGAIQWMEAAGPVTPVGCSASKAVLAWLPDERLLVRNDDNLYVVDRAGCATRRTIDARRMHQLTVSPDGARYAYVHRDLVYNRVRRAYEPDSTMRLAEVAGGEERTVVGFKYAPRRFAWSPDGTELAFDVESQDEPGRRLVSVFSVTTGSTSFLHPPQSGGPTEFGPAWSPAGSRILYRQGADQAWGSRAFTDQYAAAVPESAGAELVGWADEDAIILKRIDGTLALVDLLAGTTHALPVGIDLVAVRPIPVAP